VGDPERFQAALELRDEEREWSLSAGDAVRCSTCFGAEAAEARVRQEALADAGEVLRG